MSSGSSLNDLFSEVDLKTDPSRLVVRLRTSYWSDKTGLHLKKDITFLRKKSKGYHVFEEDIGMVGAQEVLDRCIDLMKLDDGIYEVYMIPHGRDYWTGLVEDWDYGFQAYGTDAATGIDKAK